MGIFKIVKNTDGGKDYLLNAINYVVHKDSYSAVGSPNVDLDNAYSQMLCVKEYFEKTSGNPLYHFIIVYNSRKAYAETQAIYFSERIAEYFKDKYQVIWSVHCKPMKAKGKYPGSLYHTHLLINSVSYINGKMYAGKYQDIYGLLDYIKRITYDKMWIVEYK